MISSSEKSFIDDVVDAYGRESAEILCSSLIEDIGNASRDLPLLRPIAGIKVAVTDKVPSNDGIRAFANGEAIKLLLSHETNIDQVAFDLTRIIYHEIGHIAHRQRNPCISEIRANASDRLWRGAIKEGIAIQAEYTPLGKEAYLVATAERGDVRAESAMQALLDNPGDNQKSRYYDFLFGDDTFPSYGYAIGHYVVDSMRDIQGKSLIELMETPVEEFTDFARTELV